MSNTWCRLWHFISTDPKWRTISRVSGQPIYLVKAVYLDMLDHASQNEDDRGDYNLAIEDIASSNDVSDTAIESIVAAMQGRVLNGTRLSGWEKRQPFKEDGTINRKSPGINYIYYVATTENYAIKVGVSRNPWARVRDLKTGSDHKFTLLATMKTNARTEFEIHEFFKDTRLNGEWFKTSKALESLVEATKNEELTTVDECVNFLRSLPQEDFLPLSVDSYCSSVVTTKEKIREDKDKKKEKDIIKENNIQKKSAKSAPVDYSPVDTPDWIDRQLWLEFLDMRAEIKKPASHSNQKVLIKALIRLRSQGNDPNLVIAQTNESQYRGFFPLKNGVKPNEKPSGIHTGFDKQNYRKIGAGFLGPDEILAKIQHGESDLH